MAPWGSNASAISRLSSGYGSTSARHVYPSPSSQRITMLASQRPSNTSAASCVLGALLQEVLGITAGDAASAIARLSADRSSATDMPTLRAPC